MSLWKYFASGERNGEVENGLYRLRGLQQKRIDQ